MFNNAFTVASPLTITAVLDGFTITKGKTPDVGHGGGMLNVNASPTLTHLKFIDNFAGGNGGGMMNINASSPVVSHVEFSNNRSLSYGGGVYNSGSTASYTNVLISNNTCSVHGGGMNNSSAASVSLTNVAIINNTGVSGGGLYNHTSSPTLTNVTISGNTSQTGGGMNNYNSPTLAINNTIVWGNTATAVGPSIYNSNSVPVFKNSLIQGSGGSNNWTITFGTDGGNNSNQNPVFTNPETQDYSLQQASPAINKGSNALYAGLAANTKDLAENPRVYEFNDAGIIDAGAYEFQGDLLAVANLTTETLLAIVPNPAEIGQTIHFKKLSNLEIGTTKIRIFSTNGQLIFETDSEKSMTELVLPQTLQSGIYIVKYISEDKIFVSRLLVK